MKKIFILLMCACLFFACAGAEADETIIFMQDDAISVNGADITEDTQAKVYLAHRIETHEEVQKELEGVSNRVITITQAGVYRISGTAQDAQIAVRAGETDAVRIILDGVDISCRTAPAIVIYSAQDPRAAGEYGVTIELAAGSENSISGSHTGKLKEYGVKLSGALTSLVSIGFEGSGSLSVDADNEGLEVKFGHMTFNGGSFHILAGDDPINVSEDEVGVLTINDGYIFSSVKDSADGEGDGMDSNGYIVINGGTVISLAHPASSDSGIDSDMGSSINGGIVVGAGNMYDSIEKDSEQLFMMLEFTDENDGLLVIADENDVPIFAYDFPSSYRYIVVSAPELTDGNYRLYLGGEIEGEQTDGLYTSITAYVNGTRLQHGGESNERGGRDMPSDPRPEEAGGKNFAGGIDLNELLADVDLNELLEGKDLNQLLSGFAIQDILNDAQLSEAFPQGDAPEISPKDRPEAPNGEERAMGRPDDAAAGDEQAARRPANAPEDFDGGMGEQREMPSSGGEVSTEFALSSGSTGFTGVQAAR